MTVNKAKKILLSTPLKPPVREALNVLLPDLCKTLLIVMADKAYCSCKFLRLKENPRFAMRFDKIAVRFLALVP